jgi:hypothetical protein
MKRTRKYPSPNETPSLKETQILPRDEGAGKGKNPALPRSGSFVLVGAGKAHPELPAGAKVRLRPLAKAGEDGRITWIAVSGRTPSPLGRTMGDHTVAWQVVVDELHAALYGKQVADAIAALADMRRDASEWMMTRGTPAKLLLRDLGGDMAPRWQRLEDATYHATQHVEKARIYADTDKDAALTELARAIAYHLTYLNYLPFATVPAKSARGSHGSAEGRHRAVVTGYEKKARDCAAKRQEAETARTQAEAGLLAQDQVLAKARARDQADNERLAQFPKLAPALWALFDFPAALRESHVEHVLRPSITTDLAQEFYTIQNLDNSLKTAAGTLAVTDRPSRAKAAAKAQDELTNIQKQAQTLQETTGYETFRYAAGLIKDNSKSILDSLTDLSELPKVARKAQNDRALALALEDAAETLDEIKNRSSAAPARAARVLSTLLHRHMQAVATAYPASVIDGGLLNPTPAKAAINRLKVALEGDLEYARDLADADKALGVLWEQIENSFNTLGTINVATDNEWVEDAGTESLVVTWDASKRQLSINGRAPAPNGVAGMGCHTTAWVLECEALKAITSSTTNDKQICSRLSTAVLEDLGGDVASLDKLLPADQLEGDQLVQLHQAAADVLAADNPEAAARSYLEFRNLLPFATVDEGDRGGHAERADAPEAKDLFDENAVLQAAGTVSDALKDMDRANRLSTALTDAASRLDTEAKKTGDDAWPTKVKAAARRSLNRLKGRSKILAGKLDDGALDADAADKDAETIHNVRWAEHKRVYALVHPDPTEQ